MQLKQKLYSDEATEAAKAAHRAIQHHLYEVGNKAGKLIAWLDKRDQEARRVLELKRSDSTYKRTPGGNS